MLDLNKLSSQLAEFVKTQVETEKPNFAQCEKMIGSKIPKTIFEFIKKNYQMHNDEIRDRSFINLIKNFLKENKLSENNLYDLWRIARVTIETYEKTLPDYQNFYLKRFNK